MSSPRSPRSSHDLPARIFLQSLDGSSGWVLQHFDMIGGRTVARRFYSGTIAPGQDPPRSLSSFELRWSGGMIGVEVVAVSQTDYGFEVLLAGPMNPEMRELLDELRWGQGSFSGRCLSESNTGRTF